MAYVREATVLKFGKLPKEGEGGRGGVISDPNNFAADFCSNFCNSGKGRGAIPKPKNKF